jgi:hypothetical protein
LAEDRESAMSLLRINRYVSVKKEVRHDTQGES